MVDLLSEHLPFSKKTKYSEWAWCPPDNATPDTKKCGGSGLCFEVTFDSILLMVLSEY
jgi:hypothetical protein